MTTIIRDMDYGEGGPTYRIHFECTYAGRPAQGPSYASGGQPAEGPEWTITGIDREVFGPWESRWVPIEKTHDKLAVEAVYGWAELLDLADDVAEAAQADREAYLEQQAEFRADARAEAAREREER